MMHKKSRYALIPMTVLLFSAVVSLSPPVFASDKLSQTEVRELRQNGTILSMESILAKTRTVQPGDVVEIELDREDGRYVYEVKLIDAQDRFHKLYLDAGSGEVIRQKTR